MGQMHIFAYICILFAYCAYFCAYFIFLLMHIQFCIFLHILYIWIYGYLHINAYLC